MMSCQVYSKHFIIMAMQYKDAVLTNTILWILFYNHFNENVLTSTHYLFTHNLCFKAENRKKM